MTWLAPLQQALEYQLLQRRAIMRESKRRWRAGKTVSRTEAALRTTKQRWGK